MIATSYPRDEADWQGLFIRRLASAMGDAEQLKVSIWSPDGPRHKNIAYRCTRKDIDFLDALTEKGGIAHRLKASPVAGGFDALRLLTLLRALYRREADHTEIFHVNWLQNALPLLGMRVRAVISVLGSDFKLLKLPGMVAAMRRVFASNRCILAPNSQWMVPELERLFGDLAIVHPVNFGIDDNWYAVSPAGTSAEKNWLCVTRVTAPKIGRLFDWGKMLAKNGHTLNLVGPNQGDLDIPSWVNYLGPLTADSLARDWYPRCIGFVTLSEHSEGKPQVLLETLAAGIPVVASDIPAHAELIENGRNGYLVSSQDDFHEAVSEVLNPARYAELSRNCRDQMSSEYGTWADCVARYEALYRSLLR